jgi:protocatechuate 3,4-dioxygenase alpha subunit
MRPQTPSQTIGPFFHYGLIFGGENVLVTDETQGQRILIKGQVFDGDGAPVTDSMVEIWQPDAAGHFNHPADPQQAKADQAFRGFGRSVTVDNGQFWFKTVKPGSIDEGQAPYINVRLFSRGILIHVVTRIYFGDEPATGQDPVLDTVPADRRATLIAQQEKSEDLPTYRFDIRLQGDRETVFFDP